MAKVTKHRDVVCGECGRTFITEWPRKLFCDPCGTKRRNRASGRGVEATRRAKSVALATIAERSSANKTSMVDGIVMRPDLLWSVMYRVPFAPEMSKNRRWANNGHSVTYLTRSVRQYQDMLIATTKSALSGRRIAHNKLWVSLFVQKPNHRFDAINAVDTICDAIKQAIDLDDRWFCIGQVDWEIKKADPEIFIRLGQESDEDALACSHCGIVQPVTDFPKKSGNPFGRSRVCRECASMRHAIARDERRRLLAEEAERART